MQVELIYSCLFLPCFLKKRAIRFPMKRYVEMCESLLGSLSPLRCPDDKTDFQQIRFHNLNEDVRFKLECSRYCFNSHRTASIVEYYRLEQFSVNLGKTEFVYPLQRKGVNDDTFCNVPLCLHLGIVTDTF